MIKKIHTLFFLLLLLSLLSCVESIKEPYFLIEPPQERTESNEYAKQKSNELAKDGWRVLNSYISGPQKYRYDFIHAQDYFNYSWTWNHENYNVYWGWGIIRGIQATMTEDQYLTEKYLLQSIEFLSKVPTYNCPVSELGNLNLDLANAYNLLGSFYLRINEKQKSLIALHEAEKLLHEQEGMNIQTGRILYLLAVNQFFQNNFEESMIYVKKAKKINYPIPSDFIEALEKAEISGAILCK